MRRSIIYCIAVLASAFLSSIAPALGQQSAEADPGAPDPQRFAAQIELIRELDFDDQKDRIVFTGSSSIRHWKDVQDYYPGHQIINAGFGGSHMSDLLHYLEETVLRFAPGKVFIYEGDNDIAAGRPIEVIMDNTKKVVQAIEARLPDTKIILISAKPSLARWHLKSQYEALNASFKAFAAEKATREYADVWSVMLTGEGQVRPAIFVGDGLHMNKAGYDLWHQVIEPLVVEF